MVQNVTKVSQLRTETNINGQIPLHANKNTNGNNKNIDIIIIIIIIIISSSSSSRNNTKNNNNYYYYHVAAWSSDSLSPMSRQMP